jgi:hypothetical protein
MEAFIDSFIGALGLERAYNLLVINPKWSPSLPSYTYRIGFSEAELRLLHGQVNDVHVWHMLCGQLNQGKKLCHMPRLLHDL